MQDSQRRIVQQERFRALGEMAGGVVHDFNNALMSIIGYSELLLQDEAPADDGDRLRHYLKTINMAGRDVSHVVSRLRDFYRRHRFTFASRKASGPPQPEEPSFSAGLAGRFAGSVIFPGANTQSPP